MWREGRNMCLEDDVQVLVLLLAALNIPFPLAVCFPSYVVS